MVGKDRDVFYIAPLAGIAEQHRTYLDMGMTIKTAAGLLVCCLLPLSATHADTLFGIYAGAGTWQQEYSGDVTSGISSVDVEDDLAIDDDGNTVLYAAFEHGIPLLPNVRAQHFSLDTDGENVLSRTIEFNGQVFSIADTVSTTVDVRQSDAVFYYEVLDNVVSLDLGVAVSLLEGSIEVASTLERAEADFDEVVPMLYAKLRADLPFSGFWVGAQAQGMSYEGNSLAEFDAQLGWESSVGLGMELGYRAVQIKLDAFDDVDDAELEVSGPYAAINYHF
jgi:outer membrane protein